MKDEILREAAELSFDALIEEATINILKAIKKQGKAGVKKIIKQYLTITQEFEKAQNTLKSL